MQGLEFFPSQTYLPETGETTRQMEGPSHCGNRQSRETNGQREFETKQTRRQQGYLKEESDLQTWH